MKIYIYYVSKLVLTIHKNSSKETQSNSLFAALGVIKFYQFVFILGPILIAYERMQNIELDVNKFFILVALIPFLIYDYFIFYYKERWRKVFKEVGNYSKEKREMMLYKFLAVLSIYTAAASVYMFR